MKTAMNGGPVWVRLMGVLMLVAMPGSIGLACAEWDPKACYERCMDRVKDREKCEFICEDKKK